MQKKNLPFYFLSASVFLLPFLAIPFVPLLVAKTAVIFLAVLVCFLFYVHEIVVEGRIKVPRNPIIIGGFLVIISYIFSHFFSGDPLGAFMGQGIETDTVFFTILMLAVTLFSSKFYSSGKKRVYLYLTFFLSALVLLVYHLGDLIFRLLFFYSGLSDFTFLSPLGSWTDLGIFLGLVVIMSALIFDFSLVSGRIKYFVLSFNVVSGLLIILTNQKWLWLFLLIFSAGILAYWVAYKQISKGSDKAAAPAAFPAASIFVFLLSIFFFFFGAGANELIAKSLSMPLYVELKPSLETTAEITKAILSNNVFFGSGPNTFSLAWEFVRPASVNSTLLWEYDFSSGSGYLPTALSTNGIFGIIAWFLFIGSILYVGLKNILQKNSVIDLTSFMIFISVIYLWVCLFFYSAGIVNIFLAFLFTGLLVAETEKKQKISQKEYVFKNNKTSPALLKPAIILVGLILTVFVGRNFAAATLFKIGADRAHSNNVVSQNYIKQAIKLYPRDEYYRTLAAVKFSQLLELLEVQRSRGGMETQLKILNEEIQEASAKAVIGGSSYKNWITRGGYYEFLASGGVEDSYEKAKEAYERASSLNPNSPAIKLALAKLELTHEPTEKVEDSLRQILNLKSDYAEAAILLSKLKAKADKLDEAWDLLSGFGETENIDLEYQRGAILYAKKDYAAAVPIFEKVIQLDPAHSDAKYLLGFCYYETGRNDDAIFVVSQVAELNPDNKEVTQVLKNLKEGKSPFDTQN